MMISDDSRGITRLVLGSIGLLLAWGSAGCDEALNQLSGDCETVESNYRETLESERTEVQETDQAKEADRAHVGLTLSNSLLETIVDRSVDLLVKSTLNLSGISLPNDPLNVELKSDDLCDHCFRVKLSFKDPINDSIQLIAPITLTPGDEKSAALKLDTEEYEKFVDRQLQVSGLPIGGTIQNQVDRFISKLTRKPIPIVEFDGPTFGIPTFEMFPVQLKTGTESNSVFAGFATNVAALNTSDVPAIEPITKLNDDQNMALAFQPQLIVNALSLLIGIDKVSRRYTLSGQSDSSGSLHVTLSTFQIGTSEPDMSTSGDTGVDASMPNTSDASNDGDASGDSTAGIPVALGFKLHQFEKGGLCFSAGARAGGRVGVRENSLEATLDDVEFTSSSAPREVVNLANWTSAQFIQESQTLVETSLDGDNVQMEDSELNFGPLEVSLRPNTLVLRGRSKVQDK